MMSQRQYQRVHCDIHHGSLLVRDYTDVTVSLTGRPLWRSPRFLVNMIFYRCHNIIAMHWPRCSSRFFIRKKRQWHHNVIDMQVLWHSLRYLIIKWVSMTSQCHVQAVIVTCITVFLKTVIKCKNVTMSFYIMIFSVTNRITIIPP